MFSSESFPLEKKPELSTKAIAVIFVLEFVNGVTITKLHYSFSSRLKMMQEFSQHFAPDKKFPFPEPPSKSTSPPYTISEIP